MPKYPSYKKRTPVSQTPALFGRRRFSFVSLFANNAKMIALLYILTFAALVNAEMQPSMNPGSILYMHGEKDKDWLDMDQVTDIHADAYSLVELDFNITFFGHRFDHINVDNNGYLFFYRWGNSDFHYGNFPVPDYPFQSDTPMIAPFYARVDINQNDDRQMVYYRTMHRDLSVDDPDKVIDLDQKAITRRDNKILEDVERCVHRAIVGGDLFFAKDAVMVTWRNLTYAGAKRPPSGLDTKNPKNTFQAVIATDGNQTYAMFTYDVIQWAADASFDSTLPEEDFTYARIGFNRGNGTQWDSLTRFSGLKEAVGISDSSNSDVRGRYIFRIDGIYDSLKVGGCNNESQGALQVFPNFGGMLGGEQLNVSGPCFQPSDRIRCRFDDIETVGEYVGLQRARCVAPTNLFRIGIVELSVSINDSPFGYWKTDYTVVTPDRVDHAVGLSNPFDWSAMPPPETLSIMWDKLYFAQESFSEIDIVLYGYREDPNHPDPGQRLKIRELAVLGQREDNDGLFDFRTFDVRRVPGKDYGDLEQFEMGAIAVTVSKNRDIKLWTPLLALGWWNHWDLKTKYGEIWAYERCEKWYYEDVKEQQWRKDIQPCPCKLSQAVKDVGRFIADPDCDFRKHPNTCVYNEGAHHCVRSVFSTDSGASTHCCYNPKGDLMYTQDTHGAGGANRAHMWGQSPYSKPYKVPALSRFYHDVLPYHYCCVWTQNRYEAWYNYKFYYPCKWYLEQRNTTGCDRYDPPGPAYVFGDPHFRTFNDSKFTFNGKGEFMLLESMDFKMHGFFEQSENNTYGQVNATRLSAIGMQEGSGCKIEVRVNLPTCRWRNRLQVLVNDVDILFNSTMNKWQWFKGGSQHFTGDVSVFNREEDVGTRNVTIMFPSGTGVQAVEANGVLNVYVSASPRFYKNTTGLFGFWDRWKENDLMLPSKKEYITTSDHENVYLSYGIMWHFSDQESDILLHPIGRNFSFTSMTYNLRKFVPTFGTPPLPKNASFTEEDVRKFCIKDGFTPKDTVNYLAPNGSRVWVYGEEVNMECVYDYRMTANPDIAQNTKAQGEFWKHLYAGIKPTNSCGVLPVRGDWEGAVRYAENYMSDSNVQVSCKDGYNFYGQKKWHCNREAQWEGDSWGRDEEWPMCLSVRHTAEYSGIIGAPVLGGVLILLVVFIFLRKKKREAPKRKNPFVLSDEESPDTHKMERQDSGESTSSEERRDSDEKRSFNSTAASSGGISTISGSLAPRSSAEGFHNKAVDSSSTAASTPSSTLKKKSGSIEYLETEGL